MLKQNKKQKDPTIEDIAREIFASAAPKSALEDFRKKWKIDPESDRGIRIMHDINAVREEGNSIAKMNNRLVSLMIQDPLLVKAAEESAERNGKDSSAEFKALAVKGLTGSREELVDAVNIMVCQNLT